MFSLRLAVSCNLIYGLDRQVATWVSLQLSNKPDIFDLDKSKAIGVAKGDQFIAGIVYNNFIYDFSGNPLTIEMSIASVDKSWANRHTLRALFSYPFIQLDLKRVQTTCSAQEQGVINFNERLGFKQEGYHRQAWPCGGDAISFSMLKTECKWI